MWYTILTAPAGAKGQGRKVNMGQSPIPHYYHDGIVREEPGQTWGASPHTPYYITMVGYCKKKGPAARTSYASMRPLANKLPAARAGLKCSAAPSFGYRTAYGDSLFGKHRMCQYLPTQKMMITPRAEITISAFLPFGYALRRSRV